MIPVLQQPASATPEAPDPRQFEESAVRTDAVSVIYTGFDDTLEAARVGAAMATQMAVPLRIVHFRTVPRQLDVEHPGGLSPVETDAFTTRLVDEGIAARVRVFLCRDEVATIPSAFRPHSIIVMAGRPSWWPTHVERLRHTLEAQGHFVILVNPSEQTEHVA